MKRLLSQEPREILPQLMRRLYETELNTSKGGNLSIQAEDGRWCTPSGLDKADMTANDMMFFRGDGVVIGNHDVSIETYIHMNILDRCPGRKAVIHVHALPLIEFSIMHRAPSTRLYPTRLMSQKVPVTAFRIPGSQGLADELVDAFNTTGATCAILDNHGAFFADENIFHALESLEAADFLCRTEQAAAGLGALKLMPEDAEDKLNMYAQDVMPEYKDEGSIDGDEKKSALFLGKLHCRAYKRRIFAANSGLIALRVNGTDFIMPKENSDRANLAPEDFITVRNGKLPENADQPRYASYLNRVFSAYPDINAVSISQSAYAMVFAVTDASLDSRVLPESYSKLRKIRRLPFGSLCVDDAYQKCNPQGCPVTIVDNECIVCMGKTAFDAFECSELMEEYAKIQVHVAEIGAKAIPLTDSQLKQVLFEEGRKAEVDSLRYANRLKA